MRRNSIYNKIMLAVLSVLFGITATHAESIEINLTQAGTLPQRISDSQLPTVTELILRGDMNGTDVKCIRKMTALRILNLADANIVSGGEAYYDNYQTKDNVIGIYMFSNSDWEAPLTTCMLPRSCTVIAESSLNGNNLLTEIHIPEGVKVIERSVFWACSQLADVQLPSSLETLGDDAFNYCYSLKRLHIPVNVKDIQGNVTRNTQINTLTVDERNPYYTSADNVIFTKDQSKIIIYAPLKNNFSYVVPSAVKSIERFAFYNSNQLKEITLNEGLEIISYAAFYLSGLTSIHLPASLTNIYQGAFMDSQLQSITVDDGNNNFKVTDNVLYTKDGSTFLLYPPAKIETELIVPENVVNVESFSIPCNKQLENIQFPSTLQSISAGAFMGANSSDDKKIKTIKCNSTTPPRIIDGDYLAMINLTSCILYVPSGCKETYQQAHGWSGFALIREDAAGESVNLSLTNPGTLADSLKVMPGSIIDLTISGPLNGTDIKLIRNMKKLEVLNLTYAIIVEGGEAYYTPEWNQAGYYTQNNIIGTDMFREMPELVTAHLPKTVIHIQTSGLAYCSKLTNLTLPNGLLSIGSLAFAGTNLSGDIFPYSLEQIGSQAFQGCKFTSVYLSPNIKSFANPFDSCDQLQEVQVHPDNPYYCSEDGVVFNKDKTVLVAFPAGKSKDLYTVPEGVITVGSLAFGGCNNLNKITLPETVTSIESSGIAWCERLQEINIPQSIKVIKTQTFQYCRSLQSITLPEGLETLEYWVFDGCQSLTSLRIPQSVTSVPPYSLLSYCNNLTSLIWDSSLPIPPGIFGASNDLSQPLQKNCLIYVKSGVSVPDEWNNIIRDGIADEITLTVEKQADGYAYLSNFGCPQAFTAKRISYSRDFTMESGRGDAGGWEGIVLPFTVQKFTHESKGRIAPFNSGVANARNFWLRELTPTGFKAATSLEANKPYILSMPNHNSYDEEYRLNGTVLFEAENVTIPATSLQKAAGNRFSLVPTFALTNQSDSVYSLNLYSEHDGQKAGSAFVRNLRSVNPFEVFATTNEEMQRAPSFYSIGGGNATGLKEELCLNDESAYLRISTENSALYLTSVKDQTVTIYAINGNALRTIDLHAGETTVINDLPKGVYILQNRKLLIK